MDTSPSCSHCHLPVGRLGRQRDIHGEGHWFCCYGCCLAFQVHRGSHEEPEAAAWLIRLGVGAFLAMNVMLLSLLLYAGAFSGDDAWLRDPVHWLLWMLATPMLVVLGGPFFEGAWAALRQRRVSTDLLVGIGVLAAYGYSAWQVLRGSSLVYFDTASMVLLLFTLGRYLEAQGRARAARSLAPMLAAERAEVRVVRDRVETVLALRDVRAGDLARVLPGERVPVDGRVVSGRSQCDESVLSGQPEPVAKMPGDIVHAGSLNGSGQLLVRAGADGLQSRWVHIGRLVREAVATRSLAGDSVDRVAAAFVPGVLLLAAATAWFWGSRSGIEPALLAGLSVLVVACPCSLGLAAPLAGALAIGQAAQRGILIRGGGVLERLTRLKAIAFDKTGTLTDATLQPVSLRADAAGEAEVLRCAGMLAMGSDHPLARAVVEMVRRDMPGGLEVAGDIEAQAGAGVLGHIDGMRCAIGSAALMRRLGWARPGSLLGADDESTAVFVGWQGRVHGRIGFSAAPLPEAAGVLGALQRRGLATLLLSGDRPHAVARLATTLGIAVWHAELLPEDKVRLLREWAARHGPIGMVGDGLNDGPVLASASVGIAVGGATDLARESADVVLPRGGLGCLPWLLHSAERAQRSVRANIAWAFGYNAVALTLAASGTLRPVAAAALMAASSLLVAMRSWRAERSAGAMQNEPPAAAPLSAATPLLGPGR